MTGVLRKLDRNGKTRCESTVEAEGYKFQGTVYGSLSGTSFNGYVFWGLTKPGRATAVDRLEHLWTRYSSAALALVKGPEKDAELGARQAAPGADEGSGGIAMAGA